MPLKKLRTALLLSSFASILFFQSCGDGEKKNKEELDAERIYRERCSSCHGMDGKKGLSGAKDLTASKLSMKERIEVIKNGKGAMIPFQGILSEKEIEAVAAYLDKFSKAE